MAIARLISETGVPVILFGGPTEKEFSSAKAIEEHVARTNGSIKGLHTALTTTVVDWPVRRCLALLQHCDLVVSPDTGPAWAVASREVPKVILLGHASARNITHGWTNTITLHADEARVPCWPCHRLHNDPSTCKPNSDNNGAACISDISIETIVSTVKENIK